MLNCPRTAALGSRQWPRTRPSIRRRAFHLPAWTAALKRTREERLNGLNDLAKVGGVHEYPAQLSPGGVAVMRFLFVLVPVLWATAPAHAVNTDATERGARTACLAGDATKGVQLLSELFVATKDPNFIYNQGRCFEQNRKYEDAIARFQEYLRVGKKLSQDSRADAKAHIADCEELLAKQNRQPAAVAPPPAPEPQPAPQPTPPPLLMQTGQTPSPQATPESGAGLRTAGIITAAFGGAALVGGVVFNVKANGLVSDMKKLDSYTSSKESSHSTYETVGWVGYGVGAACVAVGAVLYGLGMRAGSPSSSVALVPAFGPGRAGVLVKGAF